MGSGNILNAAYENPYTQIVIVITTDKCYENKEWLYPYRENDELGGHDIYSSSKACVELLSRAWQRSFCSLKENGTAIASARAGNVIGGGDWTADRLVVDLIKSRYTGSDLQIRSPESTRPWQHVLEPLSGYLQLAMKISADKTLSSLTRFSIMRLTELCLDWSFNQFDPENIQEMPSLFLQIGTYSIIAGLIVGLCSLLTRHWESVQIDK